MPTLSVNTAILIILGAAVVVLIILLIVALNRMNKLAGRVAGAPQSQEDGSLIGYSRDDLRNFINQQNHQIAALTMAQQRCLSRVGLVRFNPFEDTGGDLSFALVLASSEGDGVLITSLHARNNTRFYAKQLQHWNAAVTLSAEELDAVRHAQQLN